MVVAHLNGNAEIVMTEISSIGAINDTDIVNTTSDLQKELVNSVSLWYLGDETDNQLGLLMQA